MQSIRQNYLNQGVAPATAEIMLRAQRPSTHRQYQSYISLWLDHCRMRNIDALQPPVPKVLDFMEELREARKLGYNALNIVRSALSSIIVLPDGTPFGQTRLTKIYMKGVFNTKPPVPRYVDTWDPATVLRFLKKWNPPSKLTLKQLTFKVAMLIVLVTGQRIQTLVLLHVNCMSVNRDSVVFRIFDLLKQSRPGYRNPEIVLKAYPTDKTLCIFTFLLAYIRRTKPLRENTTALFLTLNKPHSAASKDTVSRWVKATMSAAGIDTSRFAPHSVRCASTSAAHRGGAPVNEIMQKAGWSSDNVFAKFYNKPLHTVTFQNAVLEIKD